MTADRPYRSPQDGVAGGVTGGVVHHLQAHDVHVGDHEPACGSARTIDLVVEVNQADSARARPGQRIRLGNGQLLQQLGAVSLSLHPVASGLLAIPGRLFTIGGGSRARLGRRLAVDRSPHSIHLGPTCDVDPDEGELVIGTLEFARRLPIKQRGGLIARRRRRIASICGQITSCGGLKAPQSAALSLHGTAIAQRPRELMHTGVPTVFLIAIAGGLITIGGVLVSIGRGLVGVRPLLVNVREGLVALSEGLKLVTQRRGRINVLRHSTARTVRRIGTIG